MERDASRDYSPEVGAKRRRSKARKIVETSDDDEVFIKLP
jgi:hypothetical protein